jgi:hypothetical protein
VLELKILHRSLQATLSDGLEQTAAYARHCGADEAHLLIFNRDPAVSWDDKVWQRQETLDGVKVAVWGI